MQIVCLEVCTWGTYEQNAHIPVSYPAFLWDRRDLDWDKAGTERITN